MGRNQTVWEAVAVTLLAAPASAAIDSPATIFDKAAQMRVNEGIDSLVVEGRRLVEGQAVPMWQGFRSGEAHRMELDLGDTREVTLVKGRRRWHFEVGAAANPPPTTPERIRPDVWLTFVMHQQRDPGGRRGRAFLQAHGIDESLVSLGRQDRRVVYIIGAKPWETERPQLWLDKELLLPVRLRYQDGEDWRETRLMGFDSPITSPFFPRRIEHWKNGELIEVFEVDRVEPNAPLDDRRFEAPR